jgi:hypothetical protein
MTYDRHRQPDAERRFGSSRFRVGDALDAAFVHSLTALPGAVQHSTSPECKAYSRANFRRGTTKTPPLFQAQDVINEYNYRATGVPYLTETVRGAQGFTDPTRTTIIRGVDFGVFSTDAHLIQTPAGYLLRTDECLTSPGSVLLRRSCTGRNTAFSKVDCFFGLPLKRPCCQGQLAVLHGSSVPLGCTKEGMAAKARLEPGQCSTYLGVVNAVPPPLARYSSAQVGHLLVHHSLGLPVLSFDSASRHPGLLLAFEALDLALAATQTILVR